MWQKELQEIQVVCKTVQNICQYNLQKNLHKA